MAATGFGGVDIRVLSSRILFRTHLIASDGSLVTAGTTNLYIYELQDDGTLKSYDFNDNTFKTGALTTAAIAMTHRQGNNNTQNTGLWTYALTTVSGFTAGAIYIAIVNNNSASPSYLPREFQYAGAVPANVTRTLDKEIIADGVVATGATATSIPTSSLVPSGAAVDQFVGRTLYFANDTTTTALRGAVCYITASTNAANPTFTVEMSNGGALPTSPVSGDTFILG